MTSDPSSRHTDAARRRLGHLAGLAQRTDEAEKRILAAAEDRLAAVNADLDKLRGRAIVDDAAGGQYLELTRERGQLETVIANARKAIGQ